MSELFYSCCASEENIDLVKRSGFDGIVFSGTYLSSRNEEEIYALKAKIEAAGLKTRSINAFCPPSIALVGPEFDAKKLFEYTTKLAEKARILGIRFFGIGSPLSRRISGGYDRRKAEKEWEQALRSVAEACAPFGIEALAEAICTRECNFMNTTRETLDAIERLDIGNLGLVFDLYHEAVMNESAEILTEALPYIRVLHIAEDRSGEKYYPEEIVLPIMEPYGKYLRGNFCGEFAVEAAVGQLESALPASLRVMRSLMD